MIHEMLREALGPLVGDRIYPNRFPQEPGLPAWPAIRCTVISMDPAADQCGTDDELTDDTRVQIDIVSDKYSQVETLRAQAIAALMNTEEPCVRLPGGFDTFDADTKTHRCTFEYMFHPSSPI